MSGSPAHEIGIVHYPGAQVACIQGLTDLFGIASTIALDQRRSGQNTLRVTHWKPIDSFDANLSCVYDSAPRGSTQPRTLIIPPTMVNLPNPDIPAGVVSWVRNRLSVVDAVRCAIEMQNGMIERNAGLPPERRIEFRVGIHLGDVVEESDGDLMGDSVNIAARLEGIADPGRGRLPPSA